MTRIEKFKDAMTQAIEDDNEDLVKKLKNRISAQKSRADKASERGDLKDFINHENAKVAKIIALLKRNLAQGCSKACIIALDKALATYLNE